MLADDEMGLSFKNKHDRSIINVDPWAAPGDNTDRTEIFTPHFKQVVLFDYAPGSGTAAA